MNAGFSNLDFLKKQLLAKSIKTDTRFDDLITAIGLGVVGQFEKFCGRRFGRVVNDQHIESADRCQFLLPRYPMESVSLIEMKETEMMGWQTLDQAPWNEVQTFNLRAGIVHFPEDDDVGQYYMQVRITYTGGYVWEQLEPDDDAYPTVQPIGANTLPDELLHAWLLQCRHVWSQLDKTGTDLLKTAEEKSLRFPTDFAMTVEKTLAAFQRYNLV